MRLIFIVSTLAALVSCAEAVALKQHAREKLPLPRLLRDGRDRTELPDSAAEAPNKAVSGQRSSTVAGKFLNNTAATLAASHNAWPPPCDHPAQTPPYKWAALKAMVGALNGLGAPYNIHGGTLLGLVRSCSIFDSDIDFVVERAWLQQNYRRAQQAFQHAGFALGDTFGFLGQAGYEEAQVKHASSLFLQAAAVGKATLQHRSGMKVDLFTIDRHSDEYIWGLWVDGEYHPCKTKSTGTQVYSWLGMDVRVPMPAEAALVSLYGDNYMTPGHWTWNVEPFTVGSCDKAGFPSAQQLWAAQEDGKKGNDLSVDLTFAAKFFGILRASVEWPLMGLTRLVHETI